MLTDEQRNELKTLILEYGIAAVMESSESRPRQINRIIDFVSGIAASAAPASDSAVFDALEKLAKGFTRPTDRQFMRHVISTTRALLNEATETVNADA